MGEGGRNLAFGREHMGRIGASLSIEMWRKLGPSVDHILKPLSLDEPSSLFSGHLLIVLLILSSEQVPSPRARQLCNESY